MPIDLIVSLMAAAIGGGGVVKLIEVFFNQKEKNEHEKERKDQEELDSNERIVSMVLRSMTSQRDEALRRVDILQRRIDHMELEISGLRIAQGRDPFPRWLVDTNGIYIFINQMFEEQFLRPKGINAEDLIGKAHEAFWPPEIAPKFRILDEEAKRRLDGRAKTHFEFEGKSLTVYKMPVKAAGTIVAFEGWITDIDYTVKV